MPNNAAKRWCFTINNWTAAELQALLDTADSFDYLCVGRERGDSGTPHLQGYFILKTKLRLNNVKVLPGLNRAHLEISRGTPLEASNYCKKDNDFEEFGTLPSSQGKRTDFEALRDWLTGLDARPSDVDVLQEFPSLWGRYKNSCIDFMDKLCPKPKLVSGDLRGWQQSVHNLVNEQPNDRKIIFVVDENGNSGKSWLARYWFSEYPDMVQMISIGKRDDLAHAIDPTKSLFLFDVPRGGMQFLQYTILEQLKNRVVFSPKYNSCTKILEKTPHVVVFCNEDPDRTKMTRDRYLITNVRTI